MSPHRVYPTPGMLEFPAEPYRVKGHMFGARVRSRIILWARHLGDDVLLSPGTTVTAIGDGRVVWSEIRPGSEHERNWGGIVIIGHRHKTTDESFYSLYGHIDSLLVEEGDVVRAGQVLGKVASGNSPENGWWKIPHVHFGIYVGPWIHQVLPGYDRPFDHRTRFRWWRNPRTFIELYNGE